MVMAPIVLSMMTMPTYGDLVFIQQFKDCKGKLARDWNFDNGPVYNDELQAYVGEEGPHAFITKQGLTIRAFRENGKILSARLTSKKSWQYGYFEIRAKMNDDRGTWPAIWMLNESIRDPKTPKDQGWPRCGEIDIMEQVGFNPNQIHCSLHCQDFNFMRGTQRTLFYPLATATSEFHNYGMYWTRDAIDFYLDGKKVGGFKRPENATKDSWPYDAPYFMILNLAIGGTWGGAKGLDEKIFPTDYQVEYVKIYKLK